MKSYLMFKNEDFDPNQALPDQHEDLVKDLALDVLLKVMASNDQFVYDVSKTVLLSSLVDREAIYFRQDIVKDCINHSQIVKRIFGLAQLARENKHRRWMGIFSHYPRGVLSSAVNMMKMFSELLHELKDITDQHANEFESEGFTTFFNTIKKELTDEYLSEMDDHLDQLGFSDGAWISANLGKGNQGEGYTLRLPKKEYRKFFKRMASFFTLRTSSYSFMVDPRDQAGNRALSDLKDQGLNQVANALAQSAEHIDSFFVNLRTELAFYMGCLNLYDHLQDLNCPMTIPNLTEKHRKEHQFRDLWEICLALTKNGEVIGNDVDAAGRALFIITGANQGGKSTFLRSIGIAQLMMQAGMFVAAEEFSANLCEGIYTHFKRQEDETMKSGKLDEELSRMSGIVDLIAPHAIILFNESFSATNEREGSEIGRQILAALLDYDIKIFFVTHMYELANSFNHHHRDDTLLLQAERQEDGTRTYKLLEGKPLRTSFAEDVFREVFNNHHQ